MEYEIKKNDKTVHLSDDIEASALAYAVLLKNAMDEDNFTVRFIDHTDKTFIQFVKETGKLP